MTAAVALRPAAACGAPRVRRLANELRERDLIDTSECYIDAPFANGRGGGLDIGNTKCGKGVKIMAIVDRAGLPLSVSTHAANH